MLNTESGPSETSGQPDIRNVSYNPVQAQFVQKMFSQASVYISDLLDQLSALYKQYGIKYDIADCYDTLMRMLTPFELLTFFNIETPTTMLNQHYINQFTAHFPSIHATHKLPYNFSHSWGIQNWKSFPKSRVEVELKNQRNKNIDMNDFSQKDDEQNQEPSQPQKNSNQVKTSRFSNGGRPILLPDQQIKVQNFIRNQVSKGVALTMPQIAREAKRISKGNKNFQASLGWVKNFMKRYPQMRQIYQFSRMAKNSVRFPRSMKIYQKLNPPQISDKNEKKEEFYEGKLENGEYGSIFQENDSSYDERENSARQIVNSDETEFEGDQIQKVSDLRSNMKTGSQAKSGRNTIDDLNN